MIFTRFVDYRELTVLNYMKFVSSNPKRITAGYRNNIIKKDDKHQFVYFVTRIHDIKVRCHCILQADIEIDVGIRIYISEINKRKEFRLYKQFNLRKDLYKILAESIIHNKIYL